MSIKKKILIIEDESIVAKDIEAILEKAGFKVVGIASNVKKAIILFRQYLPDLVISDIKLGTSADGIEIMSQLLNEFPSKIIFLTAYSDDTTTKRAFELNPDNYLVKPVTENNLLVAVNLVFSKINATESNTDSDFKIRYKELSSREIDIVRLLTSKQFSSKELGNYLNISHYTVATHRKNIFRKLGVNSINELIKHMYENNLN